VTFSAPLPLPCPASPTSPLCQSLVLPFTHTSALPLPPSPPSLMRQQFDAAEGQLEGGEEEEAPAELSLHDMTERLGRLDAAKAFYAALGEQHGIGRVHE